MSFVVSRDGANIFYKDWGKPGDQPVVFHHGWPLSSDDWDSQMLFILAIQQAAVKRLVMLRNTQRDALPNWYSSAPFSG